MRSLLGLVALAIMGCATAYGPQSFSGGYSEVQLNNRVYEVTFSGNGFTSAKTVQNNLLRRCAELAQRGGFPYFLLIDRDSAENISTIHTNQPTTTTTTGTVSGGTYYGTSRTTAAPAPIRVSKYSGTAVIFLLMASELDDLEPAQAASVVDTGLLLRQIAPR